MSDPIFPEEPHKKDHIPLTDDQRKDFIEKVAAAKQAEIERKAMRAVKPRAKRGQGVKAEIVRLPTFRWSNGLPCLPWKQ